MMKNKNLYLLLSGISMVAMCFFTRCGSNKPSSVPLFTDKVLSVRVAIQSNDDWYAKLIPDESRNTAMVNASNESTSFGGGGINGAMTDYFSFEGMTSWGPLFNSDGQLHDPNSQVDAGQFVYSIHEKPIAFDWQLHAVGPRKSSYSSSSDLDESSDVKSHISTTSTSKSDAFSEARAALNDLTYDMLIFCKENAIDNIVIPAISTQIFADGDPVYKDAMYAAMSDGILRFLNENSKDTKPDKIYLNLWTPQGIERFNKQKERFNKNKKD